MVRNRSSKTDEQIIKLIMTFSLLLPIWCHVCPCHSACTHFASFKLMTLYFRSNSTMFLTLSLSQSLSHCATILNCDTSNEIVMFNLNIESKFLSIASKIRLNRYRTITIFDLTEATCRRFSRLMIPISNVQSIKRTLEMVLVAV